VPVVAAYVAGFFVTAVLFIVNFTMVHHIAQLTSKLLVIAAVHPYVDERCGLVAAAC
jgi:hypothetical protein